MHGTSDVAKSETICFRERKRSELEQSSPWQRGHQHHNPENLLDAWQRASTKCPLRDPNPRPSSFQSHIRIHSTMAGFFNITGFCPAAYRQEAGRGRGKPKSIFGVRPKNGLKLVHPARNRRGIAEKSALEGKKDGSQRKAGGRPLKRQGSPKKALSGSRFCVDPCKTSIFKY